MVPLKSHSCLWVSPCIQQPLLSIFLDWKVSGGHLRCSCIDASAVGQWNDESGQWCSGSCCWIRQLSINQEQQWRLRDVLYDGTTSLEPFNYSQRQLTCNFSLKYPNIIKQTGNENTQTYQVVVICLIKHQILVTNLQGNVVQLERRIYNHIFGVQELICYFAVGVFTFSTVGIHCCKIFRFHVTSVLRIFAPFFSDIM